MERTTELRRSSDRAPSAARAGQPTLRLALFYATPALARSFRATVGPAAIELSSFDLARFNPQGWAARKRFDAVIVERSDETGRDGSLLRWIRKAFSELPVLAYAPLSRPDRRSAFSFHLTRVPPGEVLRSLVLDARKHHEAARKASRLSHRLRETSRRLQVLSDIVSTANSILEPERVLAVIMSQIQKLIPSEAWSILLVDEQRKELTFEMALGEKGEDLNDIRLKMGEGIAGWVAQTGEPAIVNDVSRDPRFQGRFDEQTRFRTRSILAAPLVSRGRTIGVVEILNRTPGRRFTKRDLNLLLTLLEPAAIALENAILFQKTERLAVTDDLTQLHNSRYLRSYLSRELRRSSRTGSPLSLIFLDLDGFKLINDRHGHLCGSHTLFEVGAILKRAVREEDVISRYGGDEFVVVLPDTNVRGARSVADRIRRDLKAHRFLAEHGLAVELSASFGVAGFPDHGATPEDLIQKADQAMYSVKEKGKDGVGVSSELEKGE